MSFLSNLEYTKLILEKVSFDKSLFEKEYRKAVLTMSEIDRQHLESWSKVKFGYTEAIVGHFFDARPQPLNRK